MMHKALAAPARATTDGRPGFSVQWIGAAAGRALAAGSRGAVHAVFRRSFYLCGEDGGFACLGPPSLGLGPLNALTALPDGIDWRASGLRAGAPFRIAGRRLQVAGRFTFDLAEARHWRPTHGLVTADFGRSLARLAAAAQTLAPAEGFGVLVPDLALGACNLALRAAALGPLLRPTLGGVGALAAWLRAAVAAPDAQIPAPPREAARLIGAGPGLTPSGDDLIGGALIALRAAGRGGPANRLAAWALPLARAGTGAISAAHLACAAQGEGAGALHDLLAAPGSDVSRHLTAIDAIGHCSGWDALAGAVAALAAHHRAMRSR